MNSLCIIFLFSWGASATSADNSVFQIGVGIADITGPVADVNMMGYATLGQTTSGIHFRLYARAFIIKDSFGSSIVYVSCDSAMVDQVITTEVLRQLKSLYGGIYGINNVLFTGIHTHSGPGGYLQYTLYNIPSQGFYRPSFDAIVNGIMKSIANAYHNRVPGNLFWYEGKLFNASINRSPTAYLQNPLTERNEYITDGDTDKDFFMIKMTDLNKKPIGMINWFAVHATSMNNTNQLISGDNKGYASMMFEQLINTVDVLPGNGSFVAAFSSANLGDISPNIMGAKCISGAAIGTDCSANSSTCNGDSTKCIAMGPGVDMFDSTCIIAELQVNFAMNLFNSVGIPIIGDISFIHQHINMTNIKLTVNNKTVTTCPAAMGTSFAAGTTDGPGNFLFQQGLTTSNLFWNLISGGVSLFATPGLTACQAPKPILLPTGSLNIPFPWQPSIVPTQVFLIGNVLIVAVPGEFTTMAGRRLKSTLATVANQVPNVKVVISGLANAYSSYITTPEEYDVQRYEGASTIFGPHTLDAYLSQFSNLTFSLLNNQSVNPGPDPPFLLNNTIPLNATLILSPPIDTAPLFKSFGDCTTEPNAKYNVDDTVSATFISTNPRNNVNGTSFLWIQQEESDDWVTVASDANLETKFIWKRTNLLLSTSSATIEWTIPSYTTAGTYRIQHNVFINGFSSNPRVTVGTSRTFEVIN